MISLLILIRFQIDQDLYFLGMLTRVNLLTVDPLNKIQSNYAGAFVFIENFIERMEKNALYLGAKTHPNIHIFIQMETRGRYPWP